MRFESNKVGLFVARLLFLEIVASELKSFVWILDLDVPARNPTRSGSCNDNGRFCGPRSHLVAMRVVHMVVRHGDRLRPRGLVLVVTTIILLVIAQTARSDQPGCAEELAVYVKRRTAIAEDLTTHSTVVSAAIHRKRLLTSIAHLTESIRHPKLVLWCNLLGLFLANLRFRGSNILRVNEYRQQVLLGITRRRKLREPSTC